MKRYTHIVSGARVQVRDDKVMDSSWELRTDSESESAAEGYEAMTVPKLKAEIERRQRGSAPRRTWCPARARRRIWSQG
ncbi:hypothetical protein JNW90_08805 [Micromonospora sp. STR1s_5]|nr:hypothetical protein [Micromonospora sp. STR1s_5]